MKERARPANGARDAALLPALAEVLRRGGGAAHREAMRDVLMVAAVGAAGWAVPAARRTAAREGARH